MSQQGELQGFINVKIPSRIKSRSFIPWKAWKRQWVVVRRSRGSRNGVELLIGRNSQSIFQISVDDIICRTESRTQYYAFGVFPQQSKRRASIYLSGTSETDSQKWISTIRKLLKPPLLPVEENEFSVSVIDNFFSRSAGLPGLYGTLRITVEQVTIVDPFTSRNKAEWPWRALSQFHVSSTIAKEDKGHICTIVTSRSFPAGVGPIHLFCTDSVALAGSLKSKGGGFGLVSSFEDRITSRFRHHTFSCNCPEKKGRPSPSTPFSASQAALEKPPPDPRSVLLNRRLSRSEGNLLSALRQLDSSLYGFLDGRTGALDAFHGEACDFEDKVSIDSNDFFTGKGKVAPGIISAGLGLILSTPGGSEGDSESLHEYQRLHNGDSDEELTSLSFSGGCSFPIQLTSKRLQGREMKFSPPRRESGVSLASGVYEEIEDVSINLDFSSLEIVAENELESPPPLPPRREFFFKSTQEDGKNEYISLLQAPPLLKRFLSKSAGSSPLSSPPSVPRSQTTPTSAEVLCPKTSSWDSSESDYLPMLPGCGFSRNNSKTNFASKESLEEQHYMVMASIKGT